ncbi:DUF488 domain-containing protein [Phytoactinopolyspora halotolerans]|uniref:DUF488 family protein n=1 Tax=Phytoactinopolyspora halotolerans TaxID=1981512 RepID=A0A6L9S5P9_9ACTN|nr:DUF488 family protein [Phytoactinopolyspora halotolerans]NEE00419.1 DUF488 family protein [Phytoactinopolyspora halotolerans]
MTTSEPRVAVRRVYEPRKDTDGARVLVDRVWPRGLRKDDADIDEWCKDVAPSTELRKWYGHRPERFAEFARRYRAELHDAERADAMAHVHDLARSGPLCLLTATKDPGHSQAAVLAELLRERLS